VMSGPTVTLDLVPDVYDQLLRRAQSHRRQLEEEASLALAAAVTTPPTVPDDLERVLATLSALDDDTLRQVSHCQPTVEDGVLLQALLDKRTRRGLTPANVRQLGSGEVLHTRWLRLGNAAGSVEVLGRQALTEAAGAHPLFTGVRTLTVAGLPEQPLVRTAADGTMEVTAAGVTATFRPRVGGAGLASHVVSPVPSAHQRLTPLSLHSLVIDGPAARTRGQRVRAWRE
jgi:hypothetical protein